MKPSFQQSVETSELLKEAEKLEVGGILPTETVTRICGKSADECRSNAMTVSRRLLRDKGIVVVYHPTKLGGLKRLESVEIVARAGGDVRSTVRKLRRTGEALVTADDEKLSEDDRLKKHVTGTIIKLMSAVHQKRKEVAKITNTSEPLKIGDTLVDLFTKK